MEDEKFKEMVKNLAIVEEELKCLYSKLSINPLIPESINEKASQEDINHVLEIVSKLEKIFK